MQGLFHGLTLRRSRRHGLPVLLAWVRGWHKKTAEIVQIVFAPSLPHPLQLSVSFASSLQLSLSVVQIMQGRRQRSRVRGCSSLRLASSFSVPLPLLGLGRLCFLCLSFLPLSLSVSLSLWYWGRCDPVKLGRLFVVWVAAGSMHPGQTIPTVWVCMVCTTSDAWFCIV